MKPGDPVTLPDGRPGYYQYTKDGVATVLVYEFVPAKDLKRLKESK